MNIDIFYAAILVIAAFLFGCIITKNNLKTDGYFYIKKEHDIVSICRVDIMKDIDTISNERYLILKIKEDNQLESISQKIQTP